jgi:hypothetical protein
MLSFLEQNSLLVVMIVVMIIWFGIFVELIRMEKKLKILEKKNEN